MKQRVLSLFTETYLPTIGFLIFAVIFTIAALWVYRRGGKDFYEKNMANIPFKGEGAENE